MKKLVFVVAVFFSGPAFAADFEAIAFERLSYEIEAAPNGASRADSLVAYLSALDRVGAAPRASGVCLRSVLSGKVASECKSFSLEARSGGAGTGGAD